MESVQINESAARARFFALAADLLDGLMAGKYKVHAVPVDAYDSKKGHCFFVKAEDKRPAAEPATP